MPTLLLRLVGPMQSWGIQSDYTHRDTMLEPSKSGVIGLICAALGKPRDESHPDNVGKPSLASLTRLRMGVRVDREGLMQKDWQTALDVLKADGKIPPYPKHPKFTVTSDRFYLADAAFLVGLQGDNMALLRQIQTALEHPHWMLCLGRKAFAPSEPVAIPDGLQDADLWTAITSYRPRLRPKRHRLDDERIRVMLEDETGDIVRRDQPLSFEKGNRQFTVRRLRVAYCDLSESKETT